MTPRLALLAALAGGTPGCFFANIVVQNPCESRPCQIGERCSYDFECASGLCRNNSTCQAPAPPDTSCGNTPATADADAPVLFFTDLRSGPANGGENDKGPYITLYGLRFGKRDRGPQSYVTMGGVGVADYTQWNPEDDPDPAKRTRPRGLEIVVVQPGREVIGEDLDVAITVDGKTSNAVKYTAHKNGRTLFVDPSYTGTKSDGGFFSPWTSIYQAKAPAVAAGDVVFIKGGVWTGKDPETNAPGFDGFTGYANFFLSPGGSAPAATPQNPVAYVGYPLEPPTIGGTDTGGDSDYAIYPYDGNGYYTAGSLSGLTFANMIITQTKVGVEFGGVAERLVGVTFRNAHAQNGNQGMIYTIHASSGAVLGCYFNDVPNMPALRVQWDIADVELGWNEWRSVNVSGSGPVSKLHIHHNAFTNGANDHLSVTNALGALAGPSVLVNDNLFLGGGDVRLDASDAVGANHIVFEQNTLYQTGGVLRLNGAVSARNNMFFGSGAPYAENGTPAGAVTASNNLYCGGTQALPVFPGETKSATCTQAAALLFAGPAIDPAVADFTPVSAPGNPVVDAGSAVTEIGACGDYYGHLRPTGAAPDAGAAEAR